MNNPSIAEKEADIIEELNMFDDAMDRYEHIIDMGKGLVQLADVFKTDELLVKGCQSKVWLRAYEKDGRIWYEADSNTVITKGIIALLIRVLSGEKAEDIQNCRMDFIEKTGLRSHLSSQRSNGLSSMIELMKHYAKVLSEN